MKRFVLAILLAAAVAALVFAALNRPGAKASPDVTITVSHPLDVLAVRDGMLTLREAIMLATGDLHLSLLGPVECAHVSGAVYLPYPLDYCTSSHLPGAESADTIVFHPGLFPPGSPATITLVGTLYLDTGNDTVDGSAAGVIVEGEGSHAFFCFSLKSDNNAIKGLVIHSCGVGVSVRDAGNNTIGGGNVIYGNDRGVNIYGYGSSGNVVVGNYIGTDATGNTAIPGMRNNIGVSISFGSENIVGGSTEAERNVISGNGHDGVYIAFGDGNIVLGNYIGVGADGETDVHNHVGVGIKEHSENNTIGGTGSGEGNLIAFNDDEGVRVEDSIATGNTILGNSIHSNRGKGIGLVDGGNTELAPPVITGFGSVTGTACANCIIHIYSDDEDEGRVYEGFAIADGDGNWSFSDWPEGPNATATATDTDGNTSEFSAPVTVPEPPPTPSPTPSPTPTATPSPTPEATRTVHWGPGWQNATWSGASTPEEAFACAAGSYAAAYRLVSGGWDRYFPDRPDISNMTDLEPYDVFLILVTDDVTCEMPVAEPPGTERTLDWGIGWQNDGWTGPDGTTPQDAFECAEGSYAAAYRLVGGGWERYFPDRPEISNMGSLNRYDAFLILVTAPVSCTMAIAP